MTFVRSIALRSGVVVQWNDFKIFFALSSNFLEF